MYLLCFNKVTVEGLSHRAMTLFCTDERRSEAMVMNLRKENVHRTIYHVNVGAFSMYMSVYTEYTQDIDLIEGICPWINGDDETRAAEVFDIFKQCWKDPRAYSSEAALAGRVDRPLQGSPHPEHSSASFAQSFRDFNQPVTRHANRFPKFAMCHLSILLDHIVVEYTLNVLDISSAYFYAYWIWNHCWGWSVAMIVTTSLSFMGVIAKIITQKYKEQIRNPETLIKEFIEPFEYQTPYLLAILAEEAFGFLTGMQQAMVVGERTDPVGIAVIIIKAVYYAYMNFKYCQLAHNDKFKPWLITLTLTMSLMWYGCAATTMFGIVSNTPIAECV